MNIQITSGLLKKVGGTLLVLASLFSLGASVHYIQFRRMVDPFLQVVQFDINSRADQIRAKYAESQAAAQQGPATTPTTLPPTK